MINAWQMLCFKQIQIEYLINKIRKTSRRPTINRTQYIHVKEVKRNCKKYRNHLNFRRTKREIEEPVKLD